MSIFLWYSKGSQETGVWLAERLGVDDHGAVPPRYFEGSVICWGASPSEKFKWEKRNFQNVFNDPRKISELKDRKALFDGITSVGVPSVRCVVVPQNSPAEYAQICQQLDVPTEIGFTVCTSSGFKCKVVKDGAELALALGGQDNKRTHAVTNNFGSPDRVRVYVADGTILGAAQYTDELSDGAFLAKAAEVVSEDWDDYTKQQVTSVIERALKLKVVKPSCGAWTSFSVTSPVMRNRALTVANNLKFDFCAIDFSTDGTMTVLNVVTNPNLREVISVQSTITNAISGWAANNSRTAKDILTELISGATSDEASSLLEELRNVKGRIGEAADKQALEQAAAVAEQLANEQASVEHSATDEVGSGADSSPSQSAQ